MRVEIGPLRQYDVEITPSHAAETFHFALSLGVEERRDDLALAVSEREQNIPELPNQFATFPAGDDAILALG